MTTNSNLIDLLTSSIHLKKALFYKFLRNNNKFSIRYLARINGNYLSIKLGMIINFLSVLCEKDNLLEITS